MLVCILLKNTIFSDSQKIICLSLHFSQIYKLEITKKELPAVPYFDYHHGVPFFNTLNLQSTNNEKHQLQTLHMNPIGYFNEILLDIIQLYFIYRPPPPNNTTVVSLVLQLLTTKFFLTSACELGPYRLLQVYHQTTSCIN